MSESLVATPELSCLERPCAVLEAYDNHVRAINRGTYHWSDRESHFTEIEETERVLNDAFVISAGTRCIERLHDGEAHVFNKEKVICPVLAKRAGVKIEEY
ncbi:MAG: hypothetical protein U5K77_04165 [Candidatus Saccharibacteria bacterium]|nr:hypothetical protein [Candidatus Saccharibacteria bacterium]